MIGVILGAVGGALQFLLLKKLADAVTSNKDINTKTILLVFVFFYFGNRHLYLSPKTQFTLIGCFF